MSAEILVRFCAPTLAGLKVGNLFTYTYENESDLIDAIEHYNQKLNKKGVYFVILKMKRKKAMIYVYRKNRLNEILSMKDIQDFLQSYGYDQFQEEHCLELLRKHLNCDDFPHEIGVFLGYPLHDIKAFIENKGDGCKCVGYWKVYSNEKEARSTFAKFEKCVRIYQDRYEQGTDIAKLAIGL